MQNLIINKEIQTNPIRKFHFAHDLEPVADLIELCFPIQQDPDGLTYIKEMRKAARELRFFGSLSFPSSLDSSKSYGFVWETDGHIVGNLSLISLPYIGRKINLIANVAVHPNYRRQGIARKLTQKALEYLAKNGENQVWLQVKEDNLAAVNLYQSLSFTERARRTTWRIYPKDLNTQLVNNQPGVKVRQRLRKDWEYQERCLNENYPNLLRWNFPVNFRRFSPGIHQTLMNYFDGTYFKHWAVALNSGIKGVITWQKTNTFANNLWLAFSENYENELLPIALKTVLNSLSKNHMLSIDYPKGRFKKYFELLEFREFRTLIWMEHKL